MLCQVNALGRRRHLLSLLPPHALPCRVLWSGVGGRSAEAQAFSDVRFLNVVSWSCGVAGCLQPDRQPPSEYTVRRGVFRSKKGHKNRTLGMSECRIGRGQNERKESGYSQRNGTKVERSGKLDLPAHPAGLESNPASPDREIHPVRSG